MTFIIHHFYIAVEFYFLLTLQPLGHCCRQHFQTTSEATEPIQTRLHMELNGLG